jgi:hypothetical protein
MPVQGGFALVGVWGQSPQVFEGRKQFFFEKKNQKTFAIQPGI